MLKKSNFVDEADKTVQLTLAHKTFSLVILALSAVILLRYAVVLLIAGASPSILPSQDAGTLLAASRTAQWFYDSGWREPLVPFLTRIAETCGAHEIYAVRAVTAISTILTAVLVWCVATRISGRTGGLIALCVWSLNPRIILYGANGDRTTMAAGLLLAHAYLLFRARPCRARSALLVFTGAALPLLRIELLSTVLGGAAIRAFASRRDRIELKSIATTTFLSLILFLPYPVTEYFRAGDPFAGSSNYKVRFFANCEYIGQKGFPATYEELFKNPFAGAPITPAQYMFGMHSPYEIASRYVNGYWLLLTRYLPNYAVPVTAFYILTILGALATGMTREGRQEIAFVFLAHLPFAFFYPLDQVAPGSGIEARLALQTSAILACWAGSASKPIMAIYIRRRKGHLRTLENI